MVEKKRKIKSSSKQASEAPGALNSWIDLRLGGVVTVSSGESRVKITPDALNYTLKGKTERNSMVRIESVDINLKEKLKLNQENEFEYTMNIPADTDKAIVKVSASKKGKEDTFINLTIERA